MKAVCYSATQNRKVETYVTLFQALKDAAASHGIILAPHSHMMDFESAAASASRKVFVDTKISFCHFHYAKSIWRAIKKKGILHQFYSLQST